MEDRFYIVDDDKSVRKMLFNIICNNKLGEVVGEAENGTIAIREINLLNPEIVLVDILMPEIDGITLVSELKLSNKKCCFVMISQVTDKEIISKAYTSGIEFYINKPINVIETISVLNKVKEKMKLHSIINSLRIAVNGIDDLGISADKTNDKNDAIKNDIKIIFSKLGILGELGSNDIMELAILVIENGDTVFNFKMNELYEKLKSKYNDEHQLLNMATVEQRIRRTINKALNNMACIGVEDYGNEIFTAYSSTFFDFSEVHKQMNYIRGKATQGGKINVKKFMEGILTIIR